MTERRVIVNESDLRTGVQYMTVDGAHGAGVRARLQAALDALGPEMYDQERT